MSIKRSVVSGVPGSGKDHLLRRIQQPLDVVGFTVVNFGEAMAGFALRNGDVGDRDELATMPPEEIDRLVELMMKDLASGTASQVMNTHLVYRSGPALVFRADNIAAFQPTSLAYVSADPSAIVARRQADTSRTRPDESPRDIHLHQTIGYAATRALADYLEIPLVHVDNTDSNAALAAARLYEGITQ